MASVVQEQIKGGKTMKYTIGISLGYNASACIMDENQNVIYAASEERFTNTKNTKQFPLLAIKNGLETTGINPSDIVYCRYSHYQNADIYDMYRHSYGIDGKLPERTYPKLSSPISTINQIEFEETFIKAHLYMLGVNVKQIKRIHHHYAHAACSYILTPFHDKDATNLYVVMDGFGDGMSVSAWRENDNVLELLGNMPMCKSIALVYQFVTGALGYKEHQHEGKLTGLAAYGDDKKYYLEFSNLYDSFENIVSDPECDSPIVDFDIFTEMKKRTYALVNSFTKGMSDAEKFEESKHIAAALQTFAENKALEYIYGIIFNCGFTNVNIMLSGGLFANVKINQKVHELVPEVKNVFVAPPMGDEGTCIGAAAGYVLQERPDATMTNMTMRMGTSHTVDEVLDVMDDELGYELIEDAQSVAEAIGRDLSENKIVCLFDGKMEFGPRALIGRSIMYNCRDVGANDWLNKQLGRTEFMPFAPFCKEEHMRDLFHETEGKEFALKNMTVTVNCKDEFIQNYPAACHVDNTARPQVISQDENEVAWMILDEYEKITGEKALINTSFNLHNYPIIESPKVAVESWKQSNTHCLYIGCGQKWYRIIRK